MTLYERDTIPGHSSLRYDHEARFQPPLLNSITLALVIHAVVDDLEITCPYPRPYH